MYDDTAARPPRQALGSFAADPGTAALIAQAVRGDQGFLVCGLGTRGLDELVGLLASQRQMTRVAWLRHLTGGDVGGAEDGPLVLIGQPDPDETVNGLGLDLLVTNGAAADRTTAARVLLRLAPLTVAARVLTRPDPATGLSWGIRAVQTASLLT
jgi:hypothetical protein